MQESETMFRVFLQSTVILGAWIASRKQSLISELESQFTRSTSLALLGINNKGSFTYYVITEGGGGFQMITFDYERGVKLDEIVTQRTESSKMFCGHQPL